VFIRGKVWLFWGENSPRKSKRRRRDHRLAHAEGEHREAGSVGKLEIETERRRRGTAEKKVGAADICKDISKHSSLRGGPSFAARVSVLHT